jgi:3-oxoacyl-[acyl-carrier-protein] synthase-3
MRSTYNDIKICGLATAVPKKWTPVEEFVNDSDEKNLQRFKKNTGVEGRYDAGDKQTTSDLCYVAAKELILKSDVPVEEIGLLVFVTQTSDYPYPATACVLHSRLDLPEDCMAFDVNQGCAGFVYGLNIVCGIMETSNVKNALLLVGDTVGKVHRRNLTAGYVDQDDNEAKLFGDAGVAVLLSKDENAATMDMALATDGKGFKTIIRPYGGERHIEGLPISFMDGVAVLNFAIEKVPELINSLMEDIGTTPENYDCMVLHQANKLIMKTVAKRTGFKSKQNLFSIDKFGNTSSASIATALVKHYGNETEGKIKAMLCGFGIGLSWGAVSLELEKKNILPLIQTDEYFEDGYALNE